jgi:hypothetical protein
MRILLLIFVLVRLIWTCQWIVRSATRKVEDAWLEAMSEGFALTSLGATLPLLTVAWYQYMPYYFSLDYFYWEVKMRH